MTLDPALRAIAHPRRRAILRLVRQGERTAGDIAVECGLSGPAASQHLNSLRAAGLVSVRSQGTRRLYSVNLEALAGVREFLNEFWDERLAALKAGVESEQSNGDLRAAG